MRPGGSSRPMIARPVTDLPAPDSPTTPSTSPLAMSKETPSMARRVLWRETNSTCRLRTERTGSVMGIDAWSWRLLSSEFWIERVAQPVAEQVDGEDQGREREAGKSDDPPFTGKQVIVADPDQGAERRHGVGHPGAQKRQRRLGDDGEREVDGGDDKDRSHGIRQHMAQHDRGGREANQLRRRHIVLVLFHHDRAAHGAGILHPEA